jgi:hypothetical protein
MDPTGAVSPSPFFCQRISQFRNLEQIFHYNKKFIRFEVPESPGTRKFQVKSSGFRNKTHLSVHHPHPWYKLPALWGTPAVSRWPMNPAQGCSMRQLCVSLVLMLCVSVSAQTAHQPNDHQHPIKSTHAPKMPDVPNEQEITFWTLEPGWHTEIELRNNIKDRDLTVTPTLRTADGSQYPLPPITIAANDLHILDLREVLAASAPQLVDRTGAFGSLFLLYSSPFNHNLYSGSMIHLEGTPIAFHFDGVQLDEVFNQGTREGIWWLPTDSAKGLVMISNTGLKAAEVLVEAYGQTGKSTHSAVHLGPRQTQRVSIRDLLTSGGITDTSGGLRITIPPGAESVFAAEIVYDETTGFSALMNTFERSETQKVDNVVLRAPMMALSHPDPALYLPPDTVLQPKIFLRNASRQRLTFSGNLRWRTTDKSGTVDLGTTELAPDALTVIDVFQMQQDGRVPKDASWATPTISYTGRYGDLVAIVASYEAAGKYGLQTPFNDMIASQWVGSRWFADPVRNSIITVGNASDKPTRANLTLHYNQGRDKYEYEQSLQPGEQIWLDISKTIQNRVPDKNGNAMPPDVQFGTYTIRDLDHVMSQTLFEGKLTIDKKFGHASYGCGNCCSPTASYDLDPYSFDGYIGDWWQNIVWGYNSCDNSSWDVTGDAFGWGSSDGSVASVSSSGLANGAGAGGGITLSTSIWTPSGFRKCPLHLVDPVSWPVTIIAVTSFDINILVDPGFYPVNEANSVVAGQAATVRVIARTSTGAIASWYRGTVNFSSTDSSSSLPANYTFTSSDNGQHDFQATIRSVSGFSPTRNLAVSDTISGASSTNNVYVWFRVVASREGLVGSTTSTGHVITSEDHFVALPASGIQNASVRLSYGTTASETTVLDTGPWCPHPTATTGNPCVCSSDSYWNGSGTPWVVAQSCDSNNAGVDLADGTFHDLGLSGDTLIYWRFR